jgi:tRNA(Ile)-lysidine synthase
VSTLPEQVDRTIRARGLLRRGQRILAAVSGGVDSMVLLHVLYALSKRHGWRLAVAHLNHQLRGRSSNADERLVVSTARTMGLAVVAERADVRELARRGKVSVEMAAREARHHFLAHAAVRLKSGTIALGHHADDQLELFFLRLLRGSGSEGLAGMKWRNPSPGNPRIELVRPLLDQSKEVLRDYAAAAKVRFREDASNASPGFRRNRIRHELLPLLRRNYQPALDRTVLRVMNLLGAEAEFIGQAAESWLSGNQRPPFDKLPVAVQRRCLQQQLLREKVEPDFELVERLRTKPDHPVSVAPGTTLVLDHRHRVLRREFRPAKTPPARFELLSGGAGEIESDQVKIRWRIASNRGARLPEHRAGREYFDADKVGSRIVLRHWQAGDRFQPIGMSVPVKLQNLFTNRKIQRERRHDLAVATTANGELFWVENLRISERFKLSERTKRRLNWQWKRL